MAKQVQALDEQRDFFRFATSVSNILKEVAGIGYAEVSRSIHPLGHAPRHAFDGGVTPADFVSGLIVDEGFVQVRDHADARAYNLAQAALSEFVFETVGWHRSADGVYFMSQDDMTLTARPLLDKESGRFGFGIEVRTGTIEPGGSSVELGDIEGRFAGFDIKEPVSEAVEFITSSRQYHR
ncbi:hypothetical protein G6L37_03825 [Agrobacterium rubi]|nr:hypothetical protein [Agrobacterium rubi]NTF24478.1 hypothetical protein [Agrobacterium rubi]